jgi:methanogenic corrinoid protein MtbC1
MGIFVEHRATDLCVQMISHLRGLVDPPDGPVALGGAVEGDPFQIPPLMASLVLAAEGMRSVNTGPDTPLSALRAAIDEHAPRLVWLCVSTTSVPATVDADVARLADALHQAGIGLAVGGRCVASLKKLPSSVHVASSMRELAAFARGLRAGRTDAAR